MFSLRSCVATGSVSAFVLGLLVPGIASAQFGSETTPVTPPAQVTGSFNVERLDADSRDWLSDAIQGGRTPPTDPPKRGHWGSAGGVRGNVNRLDWESRSVLLVPEEVNDPAFNRYVDLGLLAQAWEEKDPTLLTDCALQLAEGERILLRSHKAFSADKLFELAIRAASQKNDSATLDRLAKAVEQRDNPALKAQIAAVSKLGGESRSADPMAMVSVEDMTPEGYASYYYLVRRIKAAQIGADRAALDALQETVKAPSDIGAPHREYLKKLIADALAEIPKDAKPDPDVEMLDKLGSASRGWFSDMTGVSTPKPIRKIAPKGISITPRQTYSDVPRTNYGNRRSHQPTGTLAIPRQGHIQRGSSILTPDGRIIPVNPSRVRGPTGTLQINR